MYQMCLVNMPFAALYLPSLALTQLKSVTEEKLGNEVSIKIAYLNHDFARFIGIELVGGDLGRGVRTGTDRDS